jgi:hypothetical protein
MLEVCNMYNFNLNRRVIIYTSYFARNTFTVNRKLYSFLIAIITYREISKYSEILEIYYCLMLLRRSHL